MSDVFIAFLLTGALSMTILCILLIVLEGARSRRDQRTEEQLDLATERLRAAMAESAIVPTAAAEFRELPLQPAALRLAAIAETVTGPELQRAVATAEHSDVKQRLGDWCTDRKWWRRLFGVRMLARMGLEEKLLLDLMGDSEESVRAAAAGAAPIDASPTVVRHLLAMLDDPDTRVRFSAQGALFASGPSSTEELLRYVSDPTSPRLAQALEVARAGAEPAFLEPALALRTLGLSPEGSPERESAEPAMQAQAGDESDPGAKSGEEQARAEGAAVRAGAARLLGAIGGEKATTGLGELLDDPEPSVRIAAMDGLSGLGPLSNGARLERALEDPVWEVRRAAAEALRLSGPLGRLYLRSARRKGGPDAAAMARAALELPTAPFGARQG